MTWRNYGQETRPPGDWVRASRMCSVLELDQNIDAFAAFAGAAEAARKRGLFYGVDILDDPRGLDRIAVAGVAFVKPLFGAAKPKQWFLGYIWEPLAEALREQYVENGTQIASELYSIHFDMKAPEVKLFILVPKGMKRDLKVQG